MSTTTHVIRRGVEARPGVARAKQRPAFVAAIAPRLRKSWHVLRRRFGAGTGTAQRLTVEKVRWLNDARSPVTLMVDDLTNAWHNRDGNETWEPGGDWGGGLQRPGSALRFLEEQLLRTYPEARVTFFAVAGPLSAYTHHQPFSHAAPLDDTDASRRFFRSLAENPRFELAYHGYNHGTPGIRTADFIQEFRGFPSLDDAVAQTRRGLDIFARATGTVPTGGKFGGYDYNEFAEDALNECGFTWWCRDWTPRDTTGRIPDEYYEPQFFGRRLVVSMPSTVHGHFWDRRQIDLLLDRRQVITIQEHISPIRPDGLVQKPNIVDDIGELHRLYRYLSGKNVWHATLTEVASYVVAREQSFLHDVTRDGFSIRYQGAVERPLLTLRIDASAICSWSRPFIEIALPDGTTANPTDWRFDSTHFRHLVTVPVQEGRYRISPRTEGAH